MDVAAFVIAEKTAVVAYEQEQRTLAVLSTRVITNYCKTESNLAASVAEYLGVMVYAIFITDKSVLNKY